MSAIKNLNKTLKNIMTNAELGNYPIFKMCHHSQRIRKGTETNINRTCFHTGKEPKSFKN